MTNETVNAAKLGNEAAINQIMEEVKYTFYSVLDSNRNGFAHAYQVEDFREEFPSVVWDAIKKYDETRGCAFNSYFHNHVYWEIGRKKKKVALGHFESPLTGLCNTEEVESYMLENLTDESYPCNNHSIDLEEIRASSRDLNPQESFIIDAALLGLERTEIRDAFTKAFDVSPQYFYIRHTQTIEKLKKKQKLVEFFDA